MNLSIEPTGEARIFVLAGRLDGTTVQTVEKALLGQLETGAIRFAFDLTALDYISSAGLRVMLLAAKKTRSGGGKVALFGLNNSVRDVFEISGFVSIFALFASREEALRFISV